MGNPTDIKANIIELGDAYTLIRDSGNVSGEYLKYKLNRQVTKTFIQEFFLEAILPYDASARVGDIIEIDILSDDKYMLMNRIPDSHENEIIDYAGVLYKCNVSGELLRPSGEVWDSQTYHKTTAWQTVKSSCYGLQTEPLYGHDLETDEELGLLGLEKHELYLPTSIGVQVLDRYIAASGEYYRVETIKRRRFSGVDVAELGEDTR